MRETHKHFSDRHGYSLAQLPVVALREMEQPDFEQLVQIIRTTADTSGSEFVRIILASKEDVHFIDVEEGVSFRPELQDAFQEGFLALGLLGWEMTEETIQGRGMTFPWHVDDPVLSKLFKRICEEAVDSVQVEFEKRSPEED